MAANDIVTVNVSQTLPPAPSRLQRTGAILTQGGTNTTPGTLSLITQGSDLTPLLAPAKAVTSLAQTTGLATLTTTSAHGWTVGDVIPIVVSGASPAAYNGVKTATVTTTTAMTFAIASGTSSPATGTITVQLGAVSELQNAVTEFFAQGSNLSVYVLELGEGIVNAGVAYLASWITANTPSPIYSYLVPKNWDANANFLTFLAGFESTTAKTYFFVTTTTGNYTSYANLKCVLALVPSPTAPTTEFTVAAAWWVTLNYNPGTASLVTPLPFSYLQDVTAYPLQGNAAQLATLKAAGVNYVDTGAEGGISNTILKWGKLMDGNQFNYWYSIDWADIQSQLTLANAVINGSNNPQAPLLYNQQGINFLQSKLVKLAGNGVAFGLANGTVKSVQLTSAQFAANVNAGLYRGQIVINAVPFLDYTAANPGDYAAGIYGGFSIAWIPQLGFEQIIVDIAATAFI